MKRTRAWRRHKDYVKAKRKKNIDAQWANSTFWRPWYDNLHQYSKNKIHCSCPMCACKSNNKHSKAACYVPHWNPLLSDLRQVISMDDDEFEYLIDSLTETYHLNHQNRHSRRKRSYR